jgi:hypothetical protein
VVKDHAAAVLVWILSGPAIISHACTPSQVAYVRRLYQMCWNETGARIAFKVLLVGADWEGVRYFAQRYRVPGSMIVVPSGVFLPTMELSSPALALVDSSSVAVWVSGAAVRITDALNLVALAQLFSYCRSGAASGGQP